ncbi:MAG: FecR domain-containing protein [Myxococcota bacterium]
MARDFKTALLEADERLLAPGLPRAVRVRLDARLFAPRRSTSRLVLAVVVLSSVLVGFGLVQWLAPQPPQVLGGFQLAPESAHRVQIAHEASIELSAGAQVVDAPRGVTVTAVTRASVRRESRGIRVLAGQAQFAVAPRAPEAGVVRVLVSAGAIEVHGTRFTVTESGAGMGQVELHEGAIDFVDEAGRHHALRPGEVLRWPVALEPPPDADEAGEDELVPLGPVRVPPRRAPSLRNQDVDWRAFDQRVHAEAVVTQLSQLRRQGAWDEAVRLLERELNRGAPDTRERLSFELGTIYTWQVKDPAAACAHWAQHRREYPAGRFEAEVDRALASLGCAE